MPAWGWFALAVLGGAQCGFVVGWLTRGLLQAASDPAPPYVPERTREALAEALGPEG